MDRVTVSHHNGTPIVLADLSGCTANELLRLIDEVPRQVRQLPQGSVLLLADFSNSEFTREVVERLKVAAVFDRPHVRRSAWVLTENLPEVLYESIRTFSGRELPIFASREEALKFLVDSNAD